VLYDKIIPIFHKPLVFNKRIQIIATHMATLLPDEGSVLDVGCGDGQICKLILDRKPGLTYEGLEVVERPACAIPMKMYDGHTLPYGDKSFDYVTFVDVLHHTESPQATIREAARVARKGIVLKDHLCETPLARTILSFMDKVGNVSHGVSLPDNYLSRKQWADAFEAVQLGKDAYTEKLGLYPTLVKPLFENGLHFVGRYTF
jgi:ubiquinone/menaquinone biosynthesis C-methylase UbiE